MPVKSQHAAHPVVSSEKKESVPPPYDWWCCTRSRGSIRISSSTAEAEKQVYVAAVVARHMGPEPGQ